MRFIEITKENWETAVKLKPRDDQADYLRIDAAMHSLARCYVQDDKPDKNIPYLIEHEGEYIGTFLFRNYGRGCNLTSFFIDENFQGRGLGRLAMSKFLAYVELNYPRAREIELTITPGNKAAENLYKSLGFEYTGEISELGNHYMEFHF